MAKYINSEDIPEDMNAIAFWEDSHGNTQWQMSKSVRGAKMIEKKHTDSKTHGWMRIERLDRMVGIMVW